MVGCEFDHWSKQMPGRRLLVHTYNSISKSLVLVHWRKRCTELMTAPKTDSAAKDKEGMN